jgi:hypothetical protein
MNVDTNGKRGNMNKLKVLKRLQTLQDVVDEKYDHISVWGAKKLEEIIEQAFECVCRRNKRSKIKSFLNGLLKD